MNSLKNLSTVAKITKNNNFSNEKKDYNSSLMELESIGYSVLRYEIEDHIEEISTMIFNKDISPRDVCFNDSKISLTEKALTGLMRRVSVDFDKLEQPILSEFNGDFPLNDIDYFTEVNAENKQTPLEFLENKIQNNNKPRPSIG